MWSKTAPVKANNHYFLATDPSLNGPFHSVPGPHGLRSRIISTLSRLTNPNAPVPASRTFLIAVTEYAWPLVSPRSIDSSISCADFAWRHMHLQQTINGFHKTARHSATLRRENTEGYCVRFWRARTDEASVAYLQSLTIVFQCKWATHQSCSISLGVHSKSSMCLLLEAAERNEYELEI